MTQDLRKHYAKEAERLLNDPIFAEALTAVREEALIALGDVDATNITEILRLQAVARCAQDVKDRLEAHILAMGTRDGGFDPNKPTAASDLG